MLKNLKMKNKVILMLFFPVLGLVFFAVNGILDKSRLTDNMSKLQKLCGLAVKFSSLVHELQKERGMTAGFLGSNGTKFNKKLPEQRLAADEKITGLDDFLKGFDSAQFGPDFKQAIEDSVADLDKLKDIRNSVSRLNIPLKEAFGYYTNTISSFLHIISSISKLSTNVEVSLLTSAYLNFLQVKERTGIERGFMSNVFSANRFGPGMFKRFNSIVTEQDTYLNVFFTFATDRQKELFNTKMQGDFAKETLNMRKIAFEKNNEGNFGIDPLRWFLTMSEKIGKLKEMEDELAGELNQKADDLKNGAKISLLWFIIIAVVNILLALVLSFLLIRSITASIRQTMTFADAMATGDFSGTLDINSKDEIGRLATAFNRMADDLGGMVSDITRNSNHLVAASEQLLDISTEMADGAQEMTEQSQTVAGATEEMSTNIGAMASAAEEMSVNIQGISSAAEEMSTNVNTVASAVEEMSSSINGVAQNAQEAGKVSNNATVRAREASDTMKALADAAQEIGQVIDDIKRIAEQTNLLALNATIEAASAGDAGRGFAVVANEVKELANQSAQATENITTRIEGVRNSSGAAVSAIEEITAIITNVNDLQSRITSSVDEQTKTANEIAGNVAEAAKAANNIASSISEVAKGSNEVSLNSIQAAQGANEVASGIQNVNSAAQHTSSGTKKIKESSDSLKKIADELGTLVARFKVK